MSAIIQHLQYFIIKQKRKLTVYRKTRHKWYKYIQTRENLGWRCIQSAYNVYPMVCGNPLLFGAVELMGSCRPKLFFLHGLLDVDCMAADQG